MKQYVEPEPLRYVRLTCFALVILSSLIGNAVVIRAVLRAKGIKSFTYLLICNLAFGEIISSCCLPLVQTYAELQDWPFSKASCHLIIPLQMTAGMVVTTSIACIAVVRYLLLVRLRVYRMTRKTSIAWIMNGIIWVIAVISVFPYFLYMTVIPGGHDKQWCLLLLPGEKFDQNYPSSRIRFMMIVHFLINYAIPLAITLVCYSIVASKLKYHINRRVAHDIKVRNVTAEGHAETEVTEISGISHHPQQDSIKEEPLTAHDDDDLGTHESDILKMFYAIVLIFVLCYLPYQCFFMLEYMGKLSWNNWQYFDITRSYLLLLTCFPSALHPMCYGLMSQFYHRAFALIFCK